jgi:hypothetical protein
LIRIHPDDEASAEESERIRRIAATALELPTDDARPPVPAVPGRADHSATVTEEADHSATVTEEEVPSAEDAREWVGDAVRSLREARYLLGHGEGADFRKLGEDLDSLYEMVRLLSGTVPANIGTVYKPAGTDRLEMARNALSDTKEFLLNARGFLEDASTTIPQAGTLVQVLDRVLRDVERELRPLSGSSQS